MPDTADQPTVHLISDSTGETLTAAARAALAQFAPHDAALLHHPMTRGAKALERVLQDIAARPGLIFHTLIDPELIARIHAEAAARGWPTVALLEPMIAALSSYLQRPPARRPGAQHVTDEQYFQRIDALDFALAHDDGNIARRLGAADVVLVGVSRTSKTPTCVYLAGKGVKAANIPLIPGQAPPEALLGLRGARPLLIGLTADPRRLAQIRSARLTALKADTRDDYAELDAIRREVIEARKLFDRLGCVVIDVTRRSIEETAAAILQKLSDSEPS